MNKRRLFLILILISTMNFAQGTNDLKMYGIVRSGILVTQGTYFYTGTGMIGFKSNTIGLGAGTGYESYPNGSVIPLYFDLRTFLTDENKINPILFGELGYSIAKINDVDGWDKGGIMYKFGAGVNINMNSGLILLVEIAYQHQNAQARITKMYYSTARGFYNEYSLQDDKYDFVSIGVGLNIN